MGEAEKLPVMRVWEKKVNQFLQLIGYAQSYNQQRNYAPKIWVFGEFYPQNLGAHYSDPQKAHPCVISRLMSYRA